MNSFQDIDKLLSLLINAKESEFDPKKIVTKLRDIKRIEKKEKGLRNNCEILSKQLTKYKEIIPLAELVHSMHISGHKEADAILQTKNMSIETISEHIQLNRQLH